MAVGDRWFYLPTHEVYGRPEAYGLRYESVRFIGSDGARLHGWFFHAVGPPRGTVVHCHGNSGNVSGHFEHVRWLPAEGWNVLCFDYRGYGRSPGRPTRRRTIEDGIAAVRYVGARPDVDADRVVLFGQSLGGAVAVVVAAECGSVRGLAVEGAFRDYRTEAMFVGTQSVLLRPLAGWVTRTMISRGLDPIDHVARIAPRPTLFVCGTRDPIVDYRQTVALHEAAADPKQLCVIDGGGHTDSMHDAIGRRRFLSFFESCVNGGTACTPRSGSSAGITDRRL